MTELSPQHRRSSPFPQRRGKTLAQRDQIEQVIYQNRGFTDVSVLREKLLQHLTHLHGESVPSPAILQIRNRNTHLRPFSSFFQRVLDPHSGNAQMRSLARNVELAAQLGWKARDFRSLPSVFDRRFNDPDDLLEPLFSIIFQDRDAGLLRQWMQALDAYVEGTSRRLLESIDQHAREQRRPVCKDVVLIGGGPLTALAASILGAFFHITVITEQHGLGKPWRNRPIYINSSSSVKDFHRPPLPLLGGGTTRMVGWQQLNSLGTDLLLGTDTKLVHCENGSVTEYIAGPRLGDLVSTNIVLHADEYLLCQRVEFPSIQRTTEGKLRLVLIDVEDGTRRELDASAVFILTGPGKERSTIAPPSSLYREHMDLLERNLRRARDLLHWHHEVLSSLEGEEHIPGIRTQCQWVYDQIGKMRIEAPHVLNLTAIEKLYEFWHDFGAHPKSFPLTDLMTRSQTTAYIGNGDTMRTLKELVEGRGPACAYPQDLECLSGKSTIYNEQATSPQEYDASNRRRYQGLYTASTTTIPFKASRYRVVSGTSRVEVTHQDEEGTRRRRLYRSVFDCTGLDRSPTEKRLPPALPVGDIRDLEGVVVARGNADAALFLAGAATGWTLRDFPEQAQTIVRVLGIPENTLSLWINGPLVERLAYTYAATRPHTKWQKR